MNITDEIINDVAVIYTNTPEWNWIQDSNYLNLKGADFKTAISTKTNKLEVVFARQITYYFLCKYTRLSLKSIGSLFCTPKQDHSTVINGRNLVNDLIDSSHIVRDMIEKIDEIIRSKHFIEYGKISDKENEMTIIYLPSNKPQNGFICG